MKKILAINGSYRNNGITDQAVDAMVNVLQSAGADVETILLREYPIQFCLNCRECTQQPGELPGRCVQDDGMKTLIDKIEQADAYILASPTNFGSVTAIFKRFMERLIVYARRCNLVKNILLEGFLSQIASPLDMEGGKGFFISVKGKELYKSF